METPTETEEATTETQTPTEPSSSRGLTYTDVVAVPFDPTDFEVTYYDVPVLLANRDAADDTSDAIDDSSVYESPMGYEIPYDDLDYIVTGSEITLLSGRLNRDEIVSTITQTGVEQVESYRGYELYASQTNATALTDETVIERFFPDSGYTTLRQAIDTIAGDESTFYASNPDFRTLVDALGDGPYVSASLYEDADSTRLTNDRGLGYRATYAGPTPTVRYVILYEDEAAVDLEELDDAIGDSTEFQGVFADPDAVEVAQEGRTVSITGELRTDQTTTTTATEETPADGGGDLSDLTTYTNETYEYSIEYLVNWIVNDTIPQQVEIEPPELDGQLRVSVTEGMGNTYTLDELADLAVSGSRDRMDDFELLDEQDTEIESGQEARVLDFTYDNPNDGADQLRSKYLLTIHEGTIYEVEFALVSERYTDEVDRTASDVVESLSLDGSEAPLQLATPIAHL